MNIESFQVGCYAVNCTFLWKNPQETWVIDPGSEGARIVDSLKQRGLACGIIVLTHGHFDHITGLPEVTRAFPNAPVYLHALDAAFAFTPINAIPQYGYPQIDQPRNLITEKSDGDTITYGGITARIIHTPGHTPGSCCLYFKEGKLLLSGDTLFAGSVGRTDFPGGSWKDMAESLKKIRDLPDELEVICGHGPQTTLGSEKVSNPYLSESGF